MARKKEKSKEILPVVETSQTGLARLDPQSLLQAAIDKGAGIETLERLVALAKDVRAEQAKSAYYEAMSEFHAKCPPIFKTDRATISTRSGGSYSYSFAPLDELNAAILPVMAEVGLSVSYRIKQEAGSVTAICRVTHELGHFEESGEVQMPIVVGKDDQGHVVGANPAQCVGIAMSYARRYALLAITGLAARDDDQDGEEHNIKPPQRASEKAKETPKPAEQPQIAVPALPTEGSIQAKVVSVEERQSKSGSPYLLVKTEGAGNLHLWKRDQFENMKAMAGRKVGFDYKDEKGFKAIIDFWISNEAEAMGAAGNPSCRTRQ